MNDVLLRLSEVIPEAKIKIKKPDTSSIEFQLFDFNIYIRFMINVANDIGTVQLFNIDFRSLSRLLLLLTLSLK